MVDVLLVGAPVVNVSLVGASMSTCVLSKISLIICPWLEVMPAMLLTHIDLIVSERKPSVAASADGAAGFVGRSVTESAVTRDVGVEPHGRRRNLAEMLG